MKAARLAWIVKGAVWSCVMRGQRGRSWNSSHGSFHDRMVFGTSELLVFMGLLGTISPTPFSLVNHDVPDTYPGLGAEVELSLRWCPI